MPDINATLDERHSTHGDFAKMSAIVQTLKGVLYRAPNWEILSPAQKEALEMDCTKTARILCGNPNEPDHWLDKAGYATLGARACAAQPATPPSRSEEPPKFLTNTRSPSPAVPFTLPAKKEEPPKSA
jgi:hypothetical protein